MTDIAPKTPADVAGESSASGNSLPYSIGQIPVILFQEIAEKVGLDDEVDINTHGLDYLMIKLRHDHPATGFRGAIGYRIDSEHHVFVLWDRIPSGEDSVFEPQPIMTLKGGPYPGPRGSSLKGGGFQEDVRYEPPISGFPATNNSVLLQGLIFARVHSLVRRPECIHDSYWDEKSWYSNVQSSRN